ncbi:inhibitory amino acid receptor subunit gbr-2B [Aphelenchoides avenae]|nr:inhibitory amino acid receptor subunit gbr-2B [Aphelenchus avenae]
MVPSLTLFVLLYCFDEAYNIGERDILRHLFSDYDKYERPRGKNASLPDGGPVMVYTQILLRSIHSIDEQNMNFDVQLTLKGRWFDERLAFANLSSPGNETLRESILVQGSSTHYRQIWKPDTFFSNERESRRHDLIAPNTAVELRKDGFVYYRERLSVTVDCPFDFRNFPFDHQECYLKLASYSRQNNDIVYEWHGADPAAAAVDLVKDPSFRLAENLKADHCESEMYTAYSCLRVTIRLERTPWAYIPQFHVPTAVLVMIAWLAFFLDKKAAAARITLCLFSIALIMALALGINWRLPRTPYLKSTDVWTGACLAFILYVLVETVLVSGDVPDLPSRTHDYDQESKF